MPVPSGYGGPTCFQRIKIGFAMGCCVGVASGVLLGGFQAFRLGLRGRDLWRTVGKTIMQAGATFGTFMAVGTGIRC